MKNAYQRSIALVALTLLGTALLAARGHADTETSGCFARHLEEAIALNEERAALYSALTQGASTAVTGKLIWMERASLPVARAFDHEAAPFQRKGVAVMCDDFVPMKAVPPFQEAMSWSAEPLSAFRSQNPYRMISRLEQALAFGGFPGVARAAEAEIARLNRVPTYHCLARHFLESILRAANLAPEYAREAREKGLRSPEALSWGFIQLQILALPLVVDADRAAAPIQAQGIPMICQDVPAIAPWR